MSDTKACTKCGVVKALTEFNKNHRMKDGHINQCRSCKWEYTKNWRENNREKHLEHKASHKRNNRGYYNALNVEREAAKIRRTVPWADQAAIKDIYDRAQVLSEATGVPMHVDHIIPLQGELVSGLHVETNLQILPAAVNISKNNTYEV